MTKSIPYLNACDDAAPQDRRSMVPLLVTTVAWVGAMIGSAAVMNRDDAAGVSARGWAAALFASAMAVPVLWAFVRYLSRTDDLNREIHLRALATGLACGFVVWPAVSLLESHGIEPGWPVAYMAVCVGYIGGVIVWRGRYR